MGAHTDWTQCRRDYSSSLETRHTTALTPTHTRMLQYLWKSWVELCSNPRRGPVLGRVKGHGSPGQVVHTISIMPTYKFKQFTLVMRMCPYNFYYAYLQIQTVHIGDADENTTSLLCCIISDASKNYPSPLSLSL